MKKTITLIASLLLTLSLFWGCENRLAWPTGELANLLPIPESKYGEVSSNDTDHLSIYVHKFSTSQYENYISACKDAGFTIDVSEGSSSYSAFNKDGYKLLLSFYSSSEKMHISLEDPMKMSTIQWPNSEIAKLIPPPSSNIGNIYWENSEGFVIYVGNTPKTDYEKYINECINLGFDIDYNKGDDYYYADNSNGYHVDIRYKGYNTISIHLEAPDENDSIINSANTDSSSGIRSEFKEAMDSYEKFFNEYCTFMKKYSSSSNQASLMNDYLDFMSQYAEMMDELNDIGNQDLTLEELSYYTEVMSRINKKLLEITQ